ncbi:hypothetical protein BKA57DRAFT_239285 [Linnemannia elongata]|nr:hypothetical protein BKA57DRAFT_239285 [Linnemannia elongata]
MRARTNWGMSQGGWVGIDRSKTSCSHHLLSSRRRRRCFPIYSSSPSTLLSFSFFLSFFLFLAFSPLQQHTTYAHSHHHSQQQHPSCRHHSQEHSYPHPSHDSSCLQPVDNTYDAYCPGRHYTADSNRTYTMNLLNKNDALSLAKVRLSCYFVQGVSGSTDGSEEERKEGTGRSRSLPEICFLSYAKWRTREILRRAKKNLLADRSSCFHSFNKHP